VLKNLPELLGPDLLHLLASLGHGDELAIVDRNYPAWSTGERVVELRGIDVITAADAILQLLPVDTFVDEPIIRMQVVDAPEEVPDVQREFLELVRRVEGRDVAMGSLPRFDFYDRVRSAYGVVVTTESRPYACFLVTAGVV
jgi:L-fucose mutarotase